MMKQSTKTIILLPFSALPIFLNINWIATDAFHQQLCCRYRRRHLAIGGLWEDCMYRSNRYAHFKSSKDDGDFNVKFSLKDEERVEVGSEKYLKGFLSSPIQDETVTERGSGLEQALKLGGGITLILVVLVVGFLASNGLI